MFLRKHLALLDSEEAVRRKRLRARIVRRNRIKKEIEQGLEPSLHRKGYQPAKFRISDDSSIFIPTFGGDSDQCGRSQDCYVAVVFRRHEEILAKDPKRKWRQERFGHLLFERKEFERAAKHLTLAITLGATSSTCWRRLAQSHFSAWQANGDWDTLWESKAAYEQAMNHLEITCNPFALFEYARVLEMLGVYTGALSVCASILQTFPRFQQIEQVKIRFVLLQRYQIFSSGEVDGSPTAAATSGSAEAIEKESVLLKCIEYTKSLLLSKQITAGDTYICVLYMHARLNELLAVSTTPAGGGAAAAKAAQESSDQSFEELFGVAVTKQIVSTQPAAKLSWSAWRAQSDSYIALAGHFNGQSEPIPAADALSRALDLLQAPPSDTRADSSRQTQSRLSLYLELARNYYQCNQMEKAIRSMEAVFVMDHYHEEARASLAAWFPGKWKYQLELEDASQVQIARVVRGIWGRNTALARRHEVNSALENKYKENPYHPLHRRNVVRALRSKYAPLFMAQDISARRIQTSARRYLYYARIRWALEAQRSKFLQQLKGKQQTRKYRYNLHVRRQLAQLLPEQFEDKFRLEDHAALLIQSSDKVSPAELLYRAQLRVARAKERVARNLQSLYRCWRDIATSSAKPFLLVATAQQEFYEELMRVQHTNSSKIQRNWRRYSAQKELGSLGGDNAKVLIQQLKRGHERQNSDVPDLELAARKIQALYRGKRIRRSLCRIKRILAPPTPSPIAALVAQCESNRDLGIETCVVLSALRSVGERRALFDFPVVILTPSSIASLDKCREAPSEQLPVQHIVSAIEYNALLRCLVCASGDFRSGRVSALFTALTNARSLRVLALGEICTDEGDCVHATAPTRLERDPTPEQDEDDDTATRTGCYALGRPRGAFSPPPLENAQLPRRRDSLKTQSPVALLSQTLRTANFTLEELYMESNSLLQEPADGACIAGFLGDFFFARYGRLRKLVLARMRFSDASAALLGPALAINTVLKHLDLHGNAVGDSGAAAIASQGLACNRSLTYLNLAENAVGSAGARALFASLAGANCSLVTLVLCNNCVMNDAVAALAAAWQQNAALALVDLRGNLVHREHLDALRAAAEERAQSPDPELRLFLARRRFSLHSEGGASPLSTFSPAASVARAQSPLQRVRRPAPLSPTAFLKRASVTPPAPQLLRAPLASAFKPKPKQKSRAAATPAPPKTKLPLLDVRKE